MVALDQKFVSISKKWAYFGSILNWSAMGLASFPKIDHAVLAISTTSQTLFINHEKKKFGMK